MVKLLVDVNMDGLAHIIQMRAYSSIWQEFSHHVDLNFLFFEDVGLDREATDEAVWKFCQEKGYFLLTANRNEASTDSLGSTIMRLGSSSSMPVFTLANSNLLTRSTSYLDRVLSRLFECLLEYDNCLGTGRIYLP